jgi:hypothetical protein
MMTFISAAQTRVFQSQLVLGRLRAYHIAYESFMGSKYARGMAAVLNGVAVAHKTFVRS